MPNSCGLTVYYPLHACAQPMRLTHSPRRSAFAWVQTYVVLRSLYYLCTQVLHRHFNVFSSVISQLYPLSTQPIKTTTFKMKGF